MKKTKVVYWTCLIIFSFVLVLEPSFISIDSSSPKIHGKIEPSKLKISTNDLCWCYNTSGKVQSVAMSDDGKYIAASAYSLNSSTYLFDSEPSPSKTASWAFTGNKSSYITFKSTETLYFNEYWYEREYINAGKEIIFNVESSSSPIGFALWDQPFENLPTTIINGGPFSEQIILAQDYFEYYSVYLKPGSSIDYNFNSTLSIEFFIADGTQLYEWFQGGSPSFYEYLKTNNSIGTFNTITQAQDYYLVWYNDNITTATVDIIYSFIAVDVIDLGGADYNANETYSTSGSFEVPRDGDWYFFIYFDPLYSSEETTSISFDVIYDIGNKICTVDISANGNYIATVNDDNVLYFFNNSISNPNESIWDFSGDKCFNDLVISKDGNYIVAATENGTIYFLNNILSEPKIELWNNTTGENISSMAVSGNGDYIVAAGWNGNIYLFNKDSSIPLWINLTGSKVNSVSMSQDGNYIVAGTYNGHILVFNRGNANPLWDYSAAGEINSVALNADGTYIIAGGSEGIIYLFARSSAIPIWSYNAGASFGDLNSHHCITISHDGKYIAAGTQDSTVYYFERSSPVPLWSYTLDAEVNAIVMSANGSYIAVGSNDKCVYLLHPKVESILLFEPFDIPGYTFFIIIGFICLISIIIIEKRIPNIHLKFPSN